MPINSYDARIILEQGAVLRALRDSTYEGGILLSVPAILGGTRSGYGGRAVFAQTEPTRASRSGYNGRLVVQGAPALNLNTPPDAPAFVYVVQLASGEWLLACGDVASLVPVTTYRFKQINPNTQAVEALVATSATAYTTVPGNEDLRGKTFVATAVNAHGIESAPSTSYTVPMPATGIDNVAGRWLNGTNQVEATWSVFPAGTLCVACVVNSAGRVLSDTVASTTGSAILTMRSDTRPGNYRIKVVML